MVSTLALAAGPAFADEAAPAKAPCAKKCGCAHSGGMVGKVRAFLMERDETTGTTRLVRIGLGVAGVATMAAGTASLATVAAAVSVVPQCAQNPGACRTALTSPIRQNPVAEMLGGNMPGPDATNR
ncbi:MAG: hypothetical protein HY904_04810 [Deltaproteobacteria bacterium]|nr:hypothetical protein [Deltaproteobacteria bacterium]